MSLTSPSTATRFKPTTTLPRAHLPRLTRVPVHALLARKQQPVSIRIWDPNLLDRLHTPLSRYAD